MDILKVHLPNQKNVFFGHLVTAIVGLLFLHFIPLPIFLTIPLAVGFGVGLMILLNVTHPPAGGNPIIVIIGSVSFDYLLSPVITGSVIIIIFAIIVNKLILKKVLPEPKIILYEIIKLFSISKPINIPTINAKINFFLFTFLC